MNSQSAYNLARQGSIYYDMRRYQDALISFRAADYIESSAERKHFIRAAEHQLKLREEAAKPITPEQAI